MPILDLYAFAASAARGAPLLGFDVGSKTIGLAVSDPDWRVASPLTVIRRKKWSDDMSALAAPVKARGVGGLVIGLPRNMNGSEGARAQSVRAFARNILSGATAHFGRVLPILLWDERFSTAAVERLLIEDDMTRKRRGEVIDKLAAAYILQGALDAMAAASGV